MAGQYSHLNFLRKVPNKLLAYFFQKTHNVLHEINFADLKENEVQPIFDSFLMLPEDKQTEIEAECQDIEHMSCQGGITALTDQAELHGDKSFQNAISKLDSFHGSAMWAFLHHPAYWAGATLFLHADNISESFWKKRNDLSSLPTYSEEKHLQELAQTICKYFRKEGRGRNCKVEVFRRNDREYFFAYPEDYAQSSVEWFRKSLASRPRHPAFEIIFVYNQAEGSLHIYAPRNTKYISDLQNIFAKTILKFDDLQKSTEEKQIYELDILANRNFQFKYPLDSGIESVAIEMLKLSMKNGRRLTLEVKSEKDLEEIYNFRDDLTLPAFKVTSAKIKVNFAATVNKKAHARSFKISFPNWCALRHEGEDAIIRKMLIDSGIEPIKAPSKPNGKAV